MHSATVVHLSSVAMARADLLAPACWRWKCIFSTVLVHKVDSLFNGFVFLDPKARRIQLVDANGFIIDQKPLKVRESIHPGSEISFACHRAKVQDRLIVMNGKLFLNGSPIVIDHSEGPSKYLEEHQIDTSAMLVHASRVLDLDFSRGMAFAKEIKKFFNTEVHPSDGSMPFIMVVSFARAYFRLDEDIVGLALEAVIGGFCGSLRVKLLHDRVFSFQVSSKLVAFHILKLKWFSCFHFKCFFHLWGSGGPNWRNEYKLWSSANDKEWTLVTHKRSKRHASAAKNSSRSQVDILNAVKQVSIPQVHSIKSTLTDLHGSSQQGVATFAQDNLITNNEPLSITIGSFVFIGTTDNPRTTAMDTSILDRKSVV